MSVSPECYSGLHAACACGDNACDCDCHWRQRLLDADARREMERTIMMGIPPVDKWPGFWRNERTGVLAPVVTDYINRKPLDARGIVTMRAYLRQWINAEAWEDGGLNVFGQEFRLLRARVELIQSQADIDQWLDEAMDIGIDPL